MQSEYGPELEQLEHFTSVTHDSDIDDLPEEFTASQTDSFTEDERMDSDDTIYSYLGSIPEEGVLEDLQIRWVRVADILELRSFCTDEDDRLPPWAPTYQASILYFSANTTESRLHTRINGTCLGDVVTYIYEICDQEHCIPENVRAFNRRFSHEDGITSDEELPRSEHSDTSSLDSTNENDMDIMWGDEGEESTTSSATEVTEWQVPSAIQCVDFIDFHPPDTENVTTGIVEGTPLSWRMFGSDIEVWHSGLDNAVVYNSSTNPSSHYLRDSVRDIPLGVILAHIYRQNGTEYRMPHALHSFLDDIDAYSALDAQGSPDREAVNGYIVGNNHDIPPLLLASISKRSSVYSDTTEGPVIDFDDDEGVYTFPTLYASDDNDREHTPSPYDSDGQESIHHGSSSPTSSHDSQALDEESDGESGYSPYSPSFQSTSPGLSNHDDESENTALMDARYGLNARGVSPVSAGYTSSTDRDEDEQRQAQESGSETLSSPLSLSSEYPSYLGARVRAGDNVQDPLASYALTASYARSVPIYLGTIEDFTTHNVLPLFPCHPSYPAPGTMCAICHEPFHDAHTPVAIVKIDGCQGHMFGYQCLRQNLSAGTRGSNKCPMCRTQWFEATWNDIDGVARQWGNVGEAEGRALVDSRRGVQVSGGFEELL